MTNNPKRNPSRPAVLDTQAANLVDRHHLKSSAEFLAFVEDQRTTAQRRADDHQSEIDRMEAEKSRSRADHETLSQRLDAEILSRRQLIADEKEIIWRAEVMLGLEQRPAPTLSEPLQRELAPQQPVQESQS